MEYYSTINKSETMSFAATWMDLESVILTEVREGEIIYIWNLKRNNTNELMIAEKEGRVSHSVKSNSLQSHGL